MMSLSNESEVESVWDYPRPPIVVPATRQARVRFAGRWIADSHRAYRVLETSHPPTYYIPAKDVDMEVLIPVSANSTLCEWKGWASYFDLEVGDKRSAQAAWTYKTPNPAFEKIKDYIAFYPSRVEACYLDQEMVQAQAGGFYGGWITSEIVGPFKGGAGTKGW